MAGPLTADAASGPPDDHTAPRHRLGAALVAALAALLALREREAMHARCAARVGAFIRPPMGTS